MGSSLFFLTAAVLLHRGTPRTPHFGILRLGAMDAFSAQGLVLVHVRTHEPLASEEPYGQQHKADGYDEESDEK